MQHYFNVMDMRSPLRYELRVDISSKALSHPLLSMVLQPIAENSITHGFQRKRKPCILFIQGQVNEESGILLLKIADNGIGIPLEKIQEIEQRYFQEEEALHNDHIGLDNVLCIYSMERIFGFLYALKKIITPSLLFIFLIFLLSHPDRLLEFVQYIS